MHRRRRFHPSRPISLCCHPTGPSGCGSNDQDQNGATTARRYRFCLAKAVETYAEVWVADEFLAVLDRTAAKVIAFSLQKAARRAGATVIVATTHTDMVPDLCPDLMIEKRFREKVRVEAFLDAAERAATKEMTRDEINDLLLKGI